MAQARVGRMACPHREVRSEKRVLGSPCGRDYLSQTWTGRCDLSLLGRSQGGRLHRAQPAWWGYGHVDCLGREACTGPAAGTEITARDTGEAGRGECHDVP